MIKNTFYRLQQLSRSFKNPSYLDRSERLQALKKLIKTNEIEIQKALHDDLKKPSFEVHLTEILPCYHELDFSLKNLKKWMQPQKVTPALPLLMAKSQIIAEPKGVVLIIAPWNYPFQLAIAPLIAAISAGNRVMLKPSELTPNTSRLLADLFNQADWQDWVHVVEGGVETSTLLLELAFDHIFFTGSSEVGKIIMQAAAKNLATVTLELGGKSPVIVDQNYDVETLAKTLAWGKFLNRGQTCVAPDYIWAHESYRNVLIPAILKQWESLVASNQNQLTAIVNERHQSRLNSYRDQLNNSQDVKIYTSADKLLSVVEGDWQNTLVGQEEIFGPILPICYFKELEEVTLSLDSQPDPLSLYIFSNKKSFIDLLLKQTRSGGVCVNDVIIHLTHPQLPFGGRGFSGQGAYHGTAGFLAFSHQRSVMQLPAPGLTWEWLHFFYPPYRADKLKWLKKF